MGCQWLPCVQGREHTAALEPYHSGTRHTLNTRVSYRSPQTSSMHPWRHGGRVGGGWLLNSLLAVPKG